MKRKFKTISLTKLFSLNHGGKWIYDRSSRCDWHCDDGKRMISRVSGIWLDVNGSENYGTHGYYLYEDGKPTILAHMQLLGKNKDG